MVAANVSRRGEERQPDPRRDLEERPSFDPRRPLQAVEELAEFFGDGRLVASR